MYGFGQFVELRYRKRLHNSARLPCSMEKSTISMAIFHSYVRHSQREWSCSRHLDTGRWDEDDDDDDDDDDGDDDDGDGDDDDDDGDDIHMMTLPLEPI